MTRLQRRIERVCLLMCDLTEGLSVLLMVGVVTSNALQIVFRYLLNDPLSWTEEVMRYSMVWISLLAGSALVFRREHVSAGLFTRVRSRPVRLLLHYAALLAIGLFAAEMAIWGFPVALANWDQTSPAADIPMVWPYLALGVGGSLMLLYVICLAILPVPAPEERA